MLNSVNLNDKGYDDLLAEAIAQIPLYSKEWTNFNVSDPGITVLENLTAFNLLQQTQINQVSDETRRAILRLLGAEGRENRAARLLLQAPVGERAIDLPPQYQLRAGSVCFETSGPVTLAPWSLKAVYAADPGGYRDVTYLMDPKVGSAAVFGREPEPGNFLCCILEGAPREGSVLRLWAQVPGGDQRNPFPAEGGPHFADVRWQYYTNAGWQDADAVDETRGLLSAGAITLTLSAGAPVPFGETPIRGCALRCLLERCAYDRPPRLLSLSANLFQVEQRETLARCYRYPGAARVEVRSALAAKGNCFVYCREESGGAYRAYRPWSGIGERGRFCLVEARADGISIRFDKNRFGYGPDRGRRSVRVVCYSDEMVHHRDLGLVYGYEDQMIPVDLAKNALQGDFSVIAETPGADGEPEYRFIHPGSDDPEELCYTVHSAEGRLLVNHAGLGVAHRLYIADCAVTRGALGNLRPLTLLSHYGGPEGAVDAVFQNPAPGRGGQSEERPEELRLRFAEELRGVNRAVLSSDYEALVLQTPGLCIHKVKAEADSAENLVRVAVKPHAEEAFPKLSGEYRREIRAYLEKSRLITTRVELYSPKYVPVDVSAVLFVRSHFQGAEEEIRALLSGLLDRVNGPGDFGGWVRFNDIYRALGGLPWVAAVDALCLTTPSGGGTAAGPDLRLDGQSLCYPGTVQLELHSHIKTR